MNNKFNIYLNFELIKQICKYRKRCLFLSKNLYKCKHPKMKFNICSTVCPFKESLVSTLEIEVKNEYK